ncbi:cysteine peptidase family C39 domain-containing protein [Thermoanaerobacter kivui]|uniref:cysteine peptidase family C39 domain-containing protein n=1 Tax=Thermoanaerobacter kivui TaxID=2325 RepID=UPI001EEE9835|nr:cysteine peptidase family C39 domain-containing protein [Thermoanaerobacter kivui]
MQHVLQQYQSNMGLIPMSKIREAAGTDKQGTSVYGLIKSAEKLGFTAKGVKANKSEDIFGL